jgi:serine/threonine protein kinase/Tol biopolymer transport system component
VLSAGSRIEHYEIIALLGAGGMGEVYRARDTRILRDVALKILHTAIANDRDSMRRFEQEARAAGMLNHPNVLTVFDVGTHDGSPFIVSELLEGTLLRDLLAAKLPLRKALDYATQIAAGLAAAHDKGLVHRDLKPENIFVLDDGRVKLLDFGLVKLIRNDNVAPDANTQRLVTDPGLVVGTVGYMSPEQVRGEVVDHRSDIFSLGVVLFEMLTGRQPFRRDSAIETMTAILNDDAPVPAEVPGGLSRLIRHALEKTATQRFQSARDVAFALDSLSDGDSSALTVAKRVTKRKNEKPSLPRFLRMTFRRGFIMNARFAPDGSAVYGAAWEDKPVEIFSSILETPDARSILKNADILSVSPTGELAVSLNHEYVAGYVTLGTLARVPLAGGAPRLVCEDVQEAQWTRDGRDLLIVRRAAGLYRIESPINNVLYQTPSWISTARLSPNEKYIAFVEHDVWGDDGGTLVVIDREGRQIARGAQKWSTTAGVAWTPKGDEVWIAADQWGQGREIVAMTMSGKARLVLPVAGRATLHDIAADGRLLIAVESGRREIISGRRGEMLERNLSWFDWSWLSSLNHSGTLALIEEQAAAARGHHVLYIRGTDGSPAVRLGEGRARGHAFSPDDRWIAAMSERPEQLQLLPTGAGQPRNISCAGFSHTLWWQFMPDGKRLVILGNMPGQPVRLHELDIEGDSPPRVLAEESVDGPFIVSSDGKWIAAAAHDHRIMLFPVERGEPRVAPGCKPGDVPIEWSDDTNSFFVQERGRTELKMFRVDISTGERQEWITSRPSDAAGILDIMPVCITPNGETYAYGYRRLLSDLYVVTGLV